MKPSLRALFTDESPEFQRQGAEFMKSDPMLSLSRRIRQSILSIRKQKLSREEAFDVLRETVSSDRPDSSPGAESDETTRVE